MQKTCTSGGRVPLPCCFRATPWPENGKSPRLEGKPPTAVTSKLGLFIDIPDEGMPSKPQPLSRQGRQLPQISAMRRCLL